MKQYIQTALFSIILLLITSNAFAQRNISMYNMQTLPQSSELNPAFQTTNNWHIGGLLTTVTPLFGQLCLPLDINFHSSSFAYNDFIYKGTGLYSDSLIWALNSQKEALKFVDKLDATNSLDFNLSLHIINFGFRVNNTYLTFDISNHTMVDFTYPGGLFELMVKGNLSDDISEKVDLSNLGLNATNYIEYGIAASHEISDDLKVGAKFKLLSGIANIESTKTDLSLTTDHQDYGLTLQTDIQFRMSQPVFILDDLYYDKTTDSLITNTTERSSDSILQNLGYDFRNPGFAIDLGFEYKVLPELDVFASVTDLGFIDWKSDVAEVKGGGSFVFNGIDAAKYIDDNDSTTVEPNMGDEYSDTIFKVFDINKTSASSYRTMLPTKLYFGATYKVLDFLNVGALYRGVYYKSNLKSAYSLSANVNTNNFSASITYTMMNGNMDNVGLGIATRMGPIQFYLVSDHVLEEITPQGMRDFNIRMGVNWIFGYRKDKAAMIEY